MGYKNTDTCLRKIADDEPLFILRAQDATADEFVDMWASKLARRLGAEHPKVIEARRCAEAMRAWPARKMPD